MSCYEWERGSIVLPAKEWSAFRKSMLEAWNEGEERFFILAQATRAVCAAAAKGVRGEDKRSEAMKAALSNVCDRTPIGDLAYRLGRILFDSDGNWGSPVTLKTPKRSDLHLMPVTQTAHIETTDFSVDFINETRTVCWEVCENNHAREYARGHWFAKKLFAALGRIQWTRGTGGTIIGNDEYNRDSISEGGGGNYVTMRFGPPEKKKKTKATAYTTSYCR